MSKKEEKLITVKVNRKVYLTLKREAKEKRGINLTYAVTEAIKLYLKELIKG